MTDNTNTAQITRRRLLRASLAAGGSGAIAGLGTGAFLHDRETFAENSQRTGSLDLALECEILKGQGTCETDQGTLSLDFGQLGLGDAGAAVVNVALQQEDTQSNPAYVWLRSQCPVPSNDLSAELTVRLFYADADGSRTTDVPIATGQLCDVADTLRNGIPLSPDGIPTVPPGEQTCLTSENPVRIRVEWELDDKYEGESEASTATTLDFAAVQCRHRNGTENPFPTIEECDCSSAFGISHIDIYACTQTAPDCHCSLLGRLELEQQSCYDQDGIGDSFIAPGVYDLYDDGDDCNDTGYDVRVTDTRTKDDGAETTAVAFELLDADSTPGPDLCGVVICAGGVAVSYDGEALAPRSNNTDGLLEAPLHRDSPVVSGRCGPQSGDQNTGKSGGGS